MLVVMIVACSSLVTCQCHRRCAANDEQHTSATSRQTRVVALRRDSVAPQVLRDFLCIFAGQTINDAALTYRYTVTHVAL